jgi:glutamate racemase
MSRDTKLIVVACNTVSAVSMNELKKKISVPLIGVLHPGARAAVHSTKSSRIGVIGTEATIESGAYQSALKSLNEEIQVHSAPCPLFVPLVEEDCISGEIARLVVSKYLDGFKNKEIDTLILGCTHYPLLKRIIKRVMGNGLALIDSAVETAHVVRDTLRDEGLLRKVNMSSKKSFYVTDAPERFKRIGERFLGESIDHIEKIDIPC